jgi:hypothetical protein
MIVAPGLLENRDLFFHDFVAFPVVHAEGVKLHLKIAQTQAEQQSISGQILQRVDHQGQQQRMTMRDQRAVA